MKVCGLSATLNESCMKQVAKVFLCKLDSLDKDRHGNVKAIHLIEQRARVTVNKEQEVRNHLECAKRGQYLVHICYDVYLFVLPEL